MVSQNLEINIGEDFYVKLLIRQGPNRAARDLTGATIFGGVKAAFSDAEPLLVFDVDYLDRPNGIVAIKAPRPVVARLQVGTKIDAKGIKYFYDVSLSHENSTQRILGGILTAKPSVTL